MVIAAASTSAYWFITRGSAIVALILLTLTVALGVASVKRIERGHDVDASRHRRLRGDRHGITAHPAFTA